MKGLRKKRLRDGRWVIVDGKGRRMGFDGDFGPWSKADIDDNMEFASDPGVTLATRKEWDDATAF